MFKNPFSFEGRIRRTEYGVSFIIFVVARVIVRIVESAMSNNPYENNSTGVFTLICLIPLLWFLWAQGAKRCHDVGNSGWWQLIPFYSLWLLFQDGQPGSNQYGENPKGIQIGGQTVYFGPNDGSGVGYPGGYSGGHNSSTNYNSTTDRPTDQGGYKNGDLYK